MRLKNRTDSNYIKLVPAYLEKFRSRSMSLELVWLPLDVIGVDLIVDLRHVLLGIVFVNGHSNRCGFDSMVFRSFGILFLAYLSRFTSGSLPFKPGSVWVPWCLRCQGCWVQLTWKDSASVQYYFNPIQFQFNVIWDGPVLGCDLFDTIQRRFSATRTRFDFGSISSMSVRLTVISYWDLDGYRSE